MRAIIFRMANVKPALIFANNRRNAIYFGLNQMGLKTREDAENIFSEIEEPQTRDYLLERLTDLHRNKGINDFAVITGVFLSEFGGLAQLLITLDSFIKGNPKARINLGLAHAASKGPATNLGAANYKNYKLSAANSSQVLEPIQGGMSCVYDPHTTDAIELLRELKLLSMPTLDSRTFETRSKAEFVRAMTDFTPAPVKIEKAVMA